jgi:hypothetical protein
MNNIKNIINKWENHEFSFDKDCAHFISEVYEETTGKNIDKYFDGKYNSKEEAQVWLDDNNYVSLADAVTDIIGVEPSPAVDAKYGDIVSLTFNDNNSLGICMGARAYFVSEVRSSLMKVPLRMCELRWSVE